MPTTTSLGDYNMVLAVTESAINTAIKYSSIWSGTFDAYPPTAPDAPPPTDSSPGLHGVSMDQPVVKLTGDNVGKDQVGMIITFTGGTLVYYSNYYYQMMSVDLTGWTLAFAASLAQTVVSSDADPSTLPAAVQQALSSDIMSVEQLFLQTNTATWDNAQITDADGVVQDDSNLTGTMIDSFKNYMAEEESTDAQMVLSYLTSSTDPTQGGNPVPGLVPTSYNYTTTKYDPAGEGYDDLSTLNYLIMTNKSPAPTDDTAGEFSQNWVPGPNTQGYGGTIGIQGSLFNTDYIEPIILPVIQSALSFSSPLSSSNHMSPWSGSKSSTEGPDLVNNTWTHSETVYATTTTSTSCTVAESTSGASLVISGQFYSKYSIDVHLLGQSIGGYYQTYTQPWSFGITLSANTNGEMSLSADNFVMNQSDLVVSDVKPNDDGNWLQNELSKMWSDLEGLFEDFESSYVYQAQQEFNNNIEAIDVDGLSDDFNSALAGISSSIVFPGGETFTYQNLSFSQEGEQNLLGNVLYLS